MAGPAYAAHVPSTLAMRNAGEVLKGEVFAHDKDNTGAVVFVSRGSRPTTNTVTIAAPRAIAKLEVEKGQEHRGGSIVHGWSPDMPLPKLDSAKAEARETRNVQRLAKQSANINEAVSLEAQNVFDGLSRTMECAWDGERILVRASGVAIDAPYKPDDATLVDGAGGDPRALERIRLMLARTREALGLPK